MGDVERFPHHEGLAGEEVDRHGRQAELGVAGQREGRIADQHVDLARLQHREADLRGGADIFDLVGIAEHGRGDGAAIGDVEPLPFAGRILEGEAGNAGVDAADQLAAFLDGIERRALDLSMSSDDKRVYIFDTTLRDGAQTQGVDFGVGDKLAIAQALDRLGIDYIEGGWPGANPTDDAFFATGRRP